MFFLRLLKNEGTRCSVEKAIAAEGKRLVGVLIEEAWRLYLLMRHRAVPYQGKPKSVVAIEGSRAQRRILARSGLARLNMGDRLLEYERIVETALLCHTAWHTAMPGQAVAEEFCESLLSSLVTKKGQNRGAATIEDVDDRYHQITIRKEGHRVNVCKIPNSFVNSVRQRLTAYLNAERVYIPWVRWSAEPTCTIQAH